MPRKPAKPKFQKIHTRTSFDRILRLYAEHRNEVLSAEGTSSSALRMGVIYPLIHVSKRELKRQAHNLIGTIHPDTRKKPLVWVYKK